MPASGDILFAPATAACFAPSSSSHTGRTFLPSVVRIVPAVGAESCLPYRCSTPSFYVNSSRSFRIGNGVSFVPSLASWVWLRLPLYLARTFLCSWTIGRAFLASQWGPYLLCQGGACFVTGVALSSSGLCLLCVLTTSKRVVISWDVSSRFLDVQSSSDIFALLGNTSIEGQPEQNQQNRRCRDRGCVPSPA